MGLARRCTLPAIRTMAGVGVPLGLQRQSQHAGVQLLFYGNRLHGIDEGVELGKAGGRAAGNFGQCRESFELFLRVHMGRHDDSVRHPAGLRAQLTLTIGQLLVRDIGLPLVAHYAQAQEKMLALTHQNHPQHPTPKLRIIEPRMLGCA